MHTSILVESTVLEQNRQIGNFGFQASMLVMGDTSKSIAKQLGDVTYTNH